MIAYRITLGLAYLTLIAFCLSMVLDIIVTRILTTRKEDETMSENKINVLDRITYRKIKSMNREQLSEYVTRVYLSGYEAGRKTAEPELLFKVFREVLLSIDSIGPTRADAIMKKLRDTLALKDSDAATEENSGAAAEEPRERDRNIARRPDYEGDGYDENGELIYDMAYCPECRHSFEEGVNDWESNFCPDCGQRLDWTPYPEEYDDEEAENNA